MMGIGYLGILKQGCMPARWRATSLTFSFFIADVMLVQPRVEFILSFIDHIAGDEDHTEKTE